MSRSPIELPEALSIIYCMSRDVKGKLHYAELNSAIVIDFAERLQNDLPQYGWKLERITNAI
jgi:hypothetical protein